MSSEHACHHDGVSTSARCYVLSFIMTGSEELITSSTYIAFTTAGLIYL
jgi:hypothetical protein